jgi:hypothetical protein
VLSIECRRTGSHGSHGRCPGIDFPQDFTLTPIGTNAVLVEGDLTAFLADVNAKEDARLQAEHDAAGPEHASWCAGPYAHRSGEPVPAPPLAGECPFCGDTDTRPFRDGSWYCVVCHQHWTPEPAQPPARPLHVIAAEIRSSWTAPYFGAIPYVIAMHGLTDLTDHYGADDGDMIVRYFLGNATTWRGPVARRIKAELRELLKAGGAR